MPAFAPPVAPPLRGAHAAPKVCVAPFAFARMCVREPPDVVGSPTSLSPSSASASPPSAEPGAALLTVSQVCAAAAQRGVLLRDSGAGPLVRFDAAWAASGARVGQISGVSLPCRRLHIESYRAAARSDLPRRPRSPPGGGGGGGLLHLTPGMLLFAAAIAAGAQRGCDAVYGLAIDDQPEQHVRLVHYLQRFGGVPVRRVGDDFRDIPDRILYGGRGTIIRGDINEMLTKATAMVERTALFISPTE